MTACSIETAPLYLLGCVVYVKKNLIVLLEYIQLVQCGECSIRVYQSFEIFSQTLSIIFLMFLATYYAQNQQYACAGINWLVSTGRVLTSPSPYKRVYMFPHQPNKAPVSPVTSPN